MSEEKRRLTAYWRENLRYLIILLLLIYLLPDIAMYIPFKL